MAVLVLLVVPTILLVSCGSKTSEGRKITKDHTGKEAEKPVKENQRVIYLAGGCFWGVRDISGD